MTSGLWFVPLWSQPDLRHRFNCRFSWLVLNCLRERIVYDNNSSEETIHSLVVTAVAVVVVVTVAAVVVVDLINHKED